MDNGSAVRVLTQMTYLCKQEVTYYLVAIHSLTIYLQMPFQFRGARCSSVVRAFAHGAMGRRIDPSWGGPIELFLVPASASQLV